MKIRSYDIGIADALECELNRQRTGLEMIPSENFVSDAVLEALGSVATNKYSEGYPGKRYYGGCEFIDEIESLAIERAKQIFGAEHVNVQPLSGAPANIAAYEALLEHGDTILGMDLSHGGHLTHGHPVTQSSKIYNFVRYKTNTEGLIDLENLRAMALEHKPKLILVGYSAYSREIDYAGVKKIADEVGALTMADIAHIAGLIAGGQMDNPVPIFDLVTTTTHKTLRGPRGGMIMCKQEFAKAVDKAVFPGLQGGPHENVIAAKAVAFKEALEPSFKEYARQIKANAKILEEEFRNREYKLMFGGTDNHLLLIDVASKGVTGAEAEAALDKAGITVNKNMIPDDPRKPMDPSGIRLGTPALTTRGMKENEMKTIADWIDDAITNHTNETMLSVIRGRVKEFASNFPLYEGLEY
ncbi:serine hydroxymethyltransferase [Candidatus Uhrbacteria bacterium CG_4_9_14_0_2_um_filter_41_50]|uniref:Serine hydroxymethyltransferase n=1 Tax=Candidatus Uhrbacteria bacterium CG_4_9_14_0_2_um_filter_41_50 TaxID=1975031 RepID=A0A2M8EPC3_9BACT|nr:MAG: serine hydroxymethyltransferase [Candidatus Uhrbacteria bacterium CG_4_10_14_3_um_filter_41_21]PIZ54621.1 MAG: serine hydroxymethyltransferase [Candidatus Uhrbacteria bacterium CG_4_10_14_0_2_um_filter_41_21]PJB84262.1 MAG: serine hydroxymethyltransferase [Candidatus Uhrbacteria bacterium CG_4_9_14_0_8_um_filter_41_16]PJC24589.1 MAG: serine hydroxymethyltransferase [Candidatus Uhrbacteria bacterium CG_4_9_14_0_2_um_filter_41_50]PJE74889.1 MAG: serine hydroxymethyltransferase [Candidatus